jgi:hypothetical protein
VADKFSRSLACRIGGVFTLVAAGMTAYVVWRDLSYVVMLGAMAIWGFSSGVVSGPVQVRMSSGLTLKNCFAVAAAISGRGVDGVGM